MTKRDRITKIVGSRNARTGVRINNSRVKTRKPHLSPRQIFLILVLLFLFMGSGIGYVWSNFERTQIGYELSQLKQEELRLRETNRKLRVELALLKSPANLEMLAVKKLGLGQPRPEQIIILP